MKIARSINSVFVLLFLVAAGLQWNDPDPALWIGVYLATALLGALPLRKTLVSKIVGFVWVLLAVTVWVREAPELNFDDEVTREIGGLLFAAVFLLFKR